ncbi:Energy-dependent translational throttle protein EttA [Porphyridium purpureum]|uniref:Probable ATP-dependent transporter ycf16 n=1 Tax=Porphyridium purpureum TaxID=35688 RepID=A0A5J4Z0C3_PORPP|nr:Energy-dependent translational throttle protein EttA [Porphyridium purpureum]|eukprot:POR9337..scf208_2
MASLAFGLGASPLQLRAQGTRFSAASRTCVVRTSAATARAGPVRMGLNASSLKKGKGGKKGKGATSGPKKDADLASSNTSIDTSRKEFVFQMHRVGKTLPTGKQILNNISLSFFPGAKIGVLGSNGSGKSSLMKIMGGVDRDFDGDALPQRNLKIGYLEQEPELTDGDTVGENIDAGVAALRNTLKRFEEVSVKMGDASLPADELESLGKEMMRLQDEIEAQNGWELDRMLDRAKDALRCPPDDALINTLSGGEKRRVALCKLLLEKPEMLLLDEPTNHLDAGSVAWLEQFLGKFPGTVVSITHDRYFLDNCANWILELDRGAGYPYEGNYSKYLEKKAERLKQEEKQESARQKMISAELEWVRSSAKGRQTKQKARMTRYEELVSESARDRDRALTAMNQIVIPAGPPLGELVVEAEDIGKSFGDKLLFENLSFNLPRGGIVGVIGANGSGKSTLFRMIAGQDVPDKGTLRVGPSVKLMYVDQNRDSLRDDNTVYEEISEGNDEVDFGGRTIAGRAYLSWFNFKGGDQQKKMRDLSGGERNRVNLAKVLKQSGNVLLLDEPSNDLDTDTLRNLEDAILQFAGCVVCISHDRWFLDRIATHILAFEGDSKVEWFEGNYAEYEANLKKRLGLDASASLEPSRLKFRSPGILGV